MPERIYKLQPNRTLALRGFDDLGAAGALHSATEDSFKVSGVFRDPADFAVLVLHDADNFYEHPSLKYLPNFDFSGLTLTFDVHYTGLMPLDSPKFPTIDWPYLDVIRADGSTAQIALFSYAEQVGGTYEPASATFTIADNGLKQFDRVTLWYMNFAFDYIVPQVECAYAFVAAGTGTEHSITVAGVPYSITETAGDTNSDVAQKLVDALAASPDVTAARTANQVDLRVQKDDGVSFTVSSSSSGATHTLYGIGEKTVASELAGQINGVDWTGLGVTLPIAGVAADEVLTVSSVLPGVDGNMITMYATSKNSRLEAAGATAPFTGGSSDATWRVTIDFSARDIDDVRQMWLTFAPPLANGAAFADTEWEATFTNWALTGTESTRTLSVAGPESVRVEEDDAWCAYTGDWGIETGFFSGGFARRASEVDDSVTVFYSCARTHDLYVGTSLYSDRGTAGVRLDGDTETDLDCELASEPSVSTRRRVRSAVAAGQHTVVLRLKTSGYFYFDFIEAAVTGDVPDALAPRNNISPALDYSTDHTYKLAPARVMWMLDRLGLTGPMNEYIGVFWWNQRKRVGATIPSVVVSFEDTFEPTDQIFVSIGGLTIGKSVFANEHNGLFASHFAYFLNETFVGVWASADGNELTITARSPKPAYSFTFDAWKETSVSSPGTVSFTGSLEDGEAGSWEVDPTQSPALNRGARDWHSDLFAECSARDREITISSSMELVNAPASFAARYPDGEPVLTAVGFGSLTSTHCTFSAEVLDYRKEVYLHVANLMADAGLIPDLQFGEVLWWYFSNWSAGNTDGGMAFYDDETMDAAATALGRPLHVFQLPNDDPDVNSGEDATFLRTRLREHVDAVMDYVHATHADARFELLFPYDVNHPEPAGVNQLGGRLNRFVNLPEEWEEKATSGLDRFKTEALDFGANSRNLDLARATIRFPLELGWPLDSVRHLIPVFRSGYPWEKEYRVAAGLGIPVVNLWAFDHVCLYGLEVREPARQGRAVLV